MTTTTEARNENLNDIQSRDRSVLRMCGFRTWHCGGADHLTGQGEPERVGTIRVSSNLLPMLGQAAVLGWTFSRTRIRRADPQQRCLAMGCGSAISLFVVVLLSLRPRRILKPRSRSPLTGPHDHIDSAQASRGSIANFRLMAPTIGTTGFRIASTMGMTGFRIAPNSGMRGF
jgi:hypothetical protein